MITYINDRLKEWARWVVSDRATIRNMLGPKNCWPQMLGESDSTESVRQVGTLVPLNDLECCETDRAICSLPDVLITTVTEYYTRIGTYEMTAKRLGISKFTLSARINQAHERLSDYIAHLARVQREADRKLYAPGSSVIPTHATASFYAPGGSVSPRLP